MTEPTLGTDETHVIFKAELSSHKSMADRSLRLVLEVGENDKPVVLRALADGWMNGECELSVVITPIVDRKSGTRATNVSADSMDEVPS